jgi:hypothetical protein
VRGEKVRGEKVRGERENGVVVIPNPSAPLRAGYVRDRAG